MRLFAQNKIQPFQISFPDTTVSGSLYDSVELIDTRKNNGKMGFVQLGMFNNIADVHFEPSLSTQLSNLIKKIRSPSARQDILYIRLRKLFFSEETSGMSERGLFYLRATAFRKTEAGFSKLKSIDTLWTNKSSIDVTKSEKRQR
jgi:hypothetical protein